MVETVDFDTTDLAGTPPVVEDVFARFGDIDLVLAAAGALGDQAELETDPGRRRSSSPPTSPVWPRALVAAAGRMRAQGHGRIVVLSSVAGERPRRANYIYGSIKSGLDAFAQGLGDSLVGSGVGVTVVRPGSWSAA